MMRTSRTMGALALLLGGCDLEPEVGAAADPGAAAVYAADCRAAAYAAALAQFDREPISGIPYADGAGACDYGERGAMNSPIDGCMACWCGDLECEAHRDCPAPAGGGTAVCDFGRCVQTCADEGDCPSGMDCALRTTEVPDGSIAPPESGGVWRCVWPIEDEFVCDAMEEFDPNPCTSYGEAAACNAAFSTELDERCQWLDLDVLAPDACAVLDTAGECVWLRGDRCDATNVCSDGATRVYTKTDGARILVATIDECTEVRGAEWDSLAPCELDPPWTDTTCGCACGS